MQAAREAYKQAMKEKWRSGQSYIRVTIGLIHQEAQSSAYVPEPERYTYFSNLKAPLDNYEVTELYATCEQDYTTVDGSMYFLPRLHSDVVLNAGIVSDSLLGSIRIQFPLPYDLKGLTVEFGKAYPVDFTIESDNNTVTVAGNQVSRFITDEIFPAATYLRVTPSKMVNGQGRLRIHQITMGVGIYFDNKKIQSASKKEHISPIMEELPSIDVTLTLENKDRLFDVENSESSVNFLEPGQEVKVIYGLELDSGIEWMPGASVMLRDWSADDETMTFHASDRFDGMDGTYYRGLYRAEGISLYELAEDVFEDAGIDSRTYWLDTYLQSVIVQNPMPVVTHKEALQIIANAARCILYQDREGNIFMKSSFIPDMTASSDHETYYSHAGQVLHKTDKVSYGMAAQDYTDVMPTQYFLPRSGTAELLPTGYISEAVAGADGRFSNNPVLEITLEAAFKCFGMTLQFGRNHPAELVYHAYKDRVFQEDYTVSGLSEITVVNHEFPEFDRLELEVTRGYPNNRVVLDTITFGDSTDYILEYGTELTKTPKGTQLAKVRELQVLRTLYNPNPEVRELAKETLTGSAQHTFYFTNPSYDISCAITEPQGGQTVTILDQSNYFVTVELTGIVGPVEVAVTGREYIVTQGKVSRTIYPTGSLETWSNPLVSSADHAADLAKWIGDYMAADREYELQYRGEPRIDANDIAFLENKYVPDLLLRIYDHTLTFNGALSGSMKARRDISNVATAKNKLAGRRLV